MTFISREFEEHLKVVKDLYEDSGTLESLETAIGASISSLKSGGKLLFCGNGGSASDSQHLATELTVRYKKDRPAIAAIALTTDSSALTAAGNDIGFDRVFSRQVEALGREGDILVAFSTSGNSANVLLAVTEAHRLGMKVIFFGGGTGGKIKPVADVSLIAPSGTTARIQECHILMGHMLCEGIERGLGYAD